MNFIHFFFVNLWNKFKLFNEKIKILSSWKKRNFQVSLQIVVINLNQKIRIELMQNKREVLIYQTIIQRLIISLYFLFQREQNSAKKISRSDNPSIDSRIRCFRRKTKKSWVFGISIRSLCAYLAIIFHF